jgi:cell wall-associated NlpC family hydrolase
VPRPDVANRRAALRLAAAAVAAAAVAPAGAAPAPDWAASQIRAVTRAGVLGSSPAAFRPQADLTQRALAGAIAAADRLQHPPAPPAPPPTPTPAGLPPVVLSSLPPGAVVAGQVDWTIAAQAFSAVDHVAFAVDGRQIGESWDAPYTAQLDTTQLADGPHQLAVNVAAAAGDVIAVWSITVANAPGAGLTPPGDSAPVPVVEAPPAPAAPAPASTPVAAPAVTHELYRAASPSRPVTIKQLDAALVGYLGLGRAARQIQAALWQAGLHPPVDTGSEAVARELGLRLDHPAAQDGLELLPSQPATRAEAAWSLAHVLELSDWQTGWVASSAASFSLPKLTPWQRRVLAAAIHYVGYPYVWGGTSPTAETELGVRSVGGFDCSGFVWRVYKLTSYRGEGRLAGVLRGRTTYQMSGEVPRSRRIPAGRLEPGDVMFFGHGPRSQPGEVDHAGIYLGNGWFVQSSGQGVTLLPFDGWYRHNFAWARRPLREAGLA